ncbi:MAG: shikimate dehydrogenase [Pseudomonadota bacterium]
MKENKYAVIGNPIKHSKSPQIHSAFAQQEGVQIDYQRIHSEESCFTETVNNFIASGGLGMNVTLPFKIKAFRKCETLSDYAQAAQAVNTISFNQQGDWIGANTDGPGFLQDLKTNLGLSLRNKNILIMGAGGSTRGILLPLLREYPYQLTIVNRTVEKAISLADAFSQEGHLHACAYDDLGKQVYDLVINATSASINATLPPIPNNIVDSESICYDLYYSDTRTSFMQWADNLNVKKSCDGLGMLIEQAAESYFIWRGFKPNTKEVFKLLRPVA